MTEIKDILPNKPEDVIPKPNVDHHIIIINDMMNEAEWKPDTTRKSIIVILKIDYYDKIEIQKRFIGAGWGDCVVSDTLHDDEYFITFTTISKPPKDE